MAGPGAPKTGGREKGTPNKLTKALKEMILGAIDDAVGQAYFAAQAEENPTAFLAVVGRILPMTVAGDSDNPLKVFTQVAYVIVDPKEPDSAE